MIFNLESPDPDCNTSYQAKTGSKRFWSYINSLRSESSGVAPLKHEGKLISDSQEKANILNKQFQSVFTTDEGSHTSDLGPSPHPTMNNVHITQPGISQLLGKLNPHKSA